MDIVWPHTCPLEPRWPFIDNLSDNLSWIWDGLSYLQLSGQLVETVGGVERAPLPCTCMPALRPAEPALQLQRCRRSCHVSIFTSLQPPLAAGVRQLHTSEQKRVEIGMKAACLLALPCHTAPIYMQVC